MTAGLAERAVTGVQTPRLQWMPEGEWDLSLGDECIAWSRDVLGCELDPAEQLDLRLMLARRPDGRWVCPEFGMCLCRRNGKSFVLIIRFLFGLLVLGEKSAEYTAHHGKTVRATFQLARRILDAAPGSIPGWHPYRSDGRERIDFDSGQVLAFSTRTKSAGRGTGADVLAVDEAQEADDDEMDALSPTLGDRSMTVPGPQLLYAGSAGNYLSVVFGRVRRRALACSSTRLGYVEWSIDDDAYWAADALERVHMATAVTSMAQANPSLNADRPDGSGLSLDWLLGQIDVLSPAGFAREHLGVGTWPKDDAHDWVIPRLRWQAQAAADAELPSGPLVFALSASSWGSDRTVTVAAAGGVEGGCYGWLERVDRGTSWVVPDVVRLVTDNRAAAVMLDAGGPAASLADPLEQALKATGAELVRMTGRDAANACGGLYDAVTADPASFTHRGQPEVDAGLAGTKRKDIGDGLWVFDRRRSETDIAALEAVAYARAGWVIYGSDATSVYEGRGMVSL